MTFLFSRNSATSIETTLVEFLSERISLLEPTFHLTIPLIFVYGCNTIWRGTNIMSKMAFLIGYMYTSLVLFLTIPRLGTGKALGWVSFTVA